MYRHCTHQLFRGVNAHADAHEILIQEGDARLEAEGKGGFVGPEHIPLVQPHHLAHRLPAAAPGSATHTWTHVISLRVCVAMGWPWKRVASAMSLDRHRAVGAWGGAVQDMSPVGKALQDNSRQLAQMQARHLQCSIRHHC